MKNPFRLSAKTWMRVLGATGAVAFVVACTTSPLGRKQLLLVPDSQMNAMGTEAFQQMKAQTPVDNNPALNTYIHCIVDPITREAAGKTPVERWEVEVFKDDSANAFALPGGKIGVHTGILPVAKTPDQLAAVLGHEVGHVIAKHGAERVSQSVATQGGLALVGAFLSGQMENPSQRNALLAALGLGAQVGLLLPFGRTQESEADLIGLNLSAAAGFDPRQSVELWQNMRAASGGKAPPEWLSTHPANETRISNLQAHMPEAMALYNQARAAGKVHRCQPPAR